MQTLIRPWNQKQCNKIIPKKWIHCHWHIKTYGFIADRIHRFINMIRAYFLENIKIQIKVWIRKVNSWNYFAENTIEQISLSIHYPVQYIFLHLQLIDQSTGAQLGLPMKIDTRATRFWRARWFSHQQLDMYSEILSLNVTELWSNSEIILRMLRAVFYPIIYNWIKATKDGVNFFFNMKVRNIEIMRSKHYTTSNMLWFRLYINRKLS
jgi:hypothetical protein